MATRLGTAAAPEDALRAPEYTEYQEYSAEELSEDEEEESDHGQSDADGADITWIQWWCEQRGNEFLCEVDEEYIRDEFNLTGLSSLVPYYQYALDTILDMPTTVETLADEQRDLVDCAAELLYGLIHARYILTPAGMHAMKLKFNTADFGRCPRSLCDNHPVLPMGTSDLACHSTVCVFCPSCTDIYHPRSRSAASLDGAYFGTTFPHLFLMSHPNLVPKESREPYVPRIFGFRIAANAGLSAVADSEDEDKLSGAAGEDSRK